MKLAWPMSMRNRIARHGQAAIRASLSPTPSEPLLFLYPAWARNSSTTQSPIKTPEPDHPPPSTLCTPICTSSTENFVSADTPTTPSFGVASNGAAQSIRSLATEILGQAPKTGPSSHRRHVTYGKRGEAIQQPTDRKIRRILYQYKKATEEKQRMFEARHDRQARRNEELLRSEDPDWRAILERLIHSTPQHGKWLTEAITVKVPERSFSRLLTGLDDNIWSIAHAYDCAIARGPQESDLGDCQTFVLSGSAVSISKTISRLLRIAPDLKIIKTTNPTGLKDAKHNASEPIRMEDLQHQSDALRNVATGKLRKTSSRREKPLPDPPSEWNQFSFYEYVFNLTHTKLPNHLHRFLYRKGDRHMAAVLKILHDLFEREALKPYVTNMAIKEAVTYFLDTSTIQEARALFNKHTINDPDIFNIMLRTPAKNNDLHNFLFILDLMLGRGFTPNRRTWNAFLNANSNNLQIQLIILSAMRDKGLLQDITALRVAYEVLAVSELEISLSNSHPPEEYLKEMDARFGPDWLSLSTANRILHILGSRGLISPACDFLQFMDSRSIKPDNLSVNTILHHCKQGHNIGLAVEMLRISPRYDNFTPNKETYRILFEMAWQTRSFNLARVIWKYACLSAMVVYRMRDLVRKSLRFGISPTSTGTLSPRNRFMKLAGSYIVAPPKQSTTFPVESHGGDPSCKDATSQEMVVVPKINVAISQVNREMSRFQDWEASRPFIEMFLEAHEMDKTWKSLESETAEKLEMSWMLENGIDVPVRRKPFRLNSIT